MNRLTHGVICIVFCLFNIYAYPFGNDNLVVSQKKISTDVNIILNVENIKSSLTHIASITDKLSGYSLSTSFNQNNNQTIGHITVRLPDQDLSNALNNIKRLAEKVRTVNLTTNDLSQQYLEAKSELTVKRGQMSQVNTLMNQATHSKEVASIFNTMLRLQSSINRLEGELKYIESITAFPKISITLYQTQLATSIDPERWMIIKSLNKGVQGLLDTLNKQYKWIIYFLIYYLPLLIIWLLFACLFYAILIRLYRYIARA